MAVYCCFKRIF